MAWLRARPQRKPRHQHHRLRVSPQAGLKVSRRLRVRARPQGRAKPQAGVKVRVGGEALARKRLRRPVLGRLS